MTKKAGQRFFILMAVFLLAFPLAGCAQLMDEFPFLQPATVEPAAPIEISATPTAVVEPTQAAPTADPNQVTIWLPPAFDPDNGSPEGKLLKKQLQLFSEANGGIDVNVRIKALSGPASLLESLTATSLAAPGALPGLVILPRNDLVAAVEARLLVPLDGDNPPSQQIETFALAAELAEVNDIAYGLPFAADALSIAYNSLQVAYPPTQWRELWQLQKILAFPAAEADAIFTALLYQDKGGDFRHNESQITLQEEALQQTLIFLADGANKNVFPYWLTNYTTYAESWQALRDARSTFSVIWASQYLEETPANTLIHPVPTFGTEDFTLADGWVIAFPETSPERFELNQKLAAYLVEPEFQGEWTESAGLIPLSEEALTVWENTEISAIVKEIAESAHLAPPAPVLDVVGPLFSQATIEMLRQKATYIESSNRIIKELAE